MNFNITPSSCANQGQLSAAIKDFRQALAICPSHRNAKKYLTATLVEQGIQSVDWKYFDYYFLVEKRWLEVCMYDKCMCLLYLRHFLWKAWWSHGKCSWLRIKRFIFEPWPGTLCCVLGQDTWLSWWLSPPRSINGYRWIDCWGNLVMDWHPI